MEAQSPQPLINDRFQIAEEINTGGMGTVFRGVDTKTNQLVAIKQLRPDILSEITLKRFKLEAQTLRDLKHPNIINVLDAFEENNHHFIIMDFVDGGVLSEKIEKESPLPFDFILELALDLADALTRTHRLNIIHRDIKPANILLSSDGTPRLTDFGIARNDSIEHITKTQGDLIGTLSYIAPDILADQENDKRVDIWSFGVVLFEMVTGKLPFTGSNAAGILISILNDPTPDIHALRPDTPAPLAALIYNMLQKDRNQRISSIRQVGAELERIIKGGKSGQYQLSDRDLGSQERRVTLLRHNLPAEITFDEMYEADRQEIRDALQDDSSRLVMVTNTEIKETSNLMLSVATGQVQETLHGVYYISFEEIKTAEEAIEAIAKATQLELDEEKKIEQQLVDHLKDKQMLLVWDEIKDTDPFKEFSTKLLASAPRLKILAHCNTPFGLDSELIIDQEYLRFKQATRKLQRGIRNYKREGIPLPEHTYQLISSEVAKSKLEIPSEASDLWRVSRAVSLRRHLMYRGMMIVLASLIAPTIVQPLEVLSGYTTIDEFVGDYIVSYVLVMLINLPSAAMLSLIESRSIPRKHRLWIWPICMGIILTLFLLATYPSGIVSYQHWTEALMGGMAGGILIGLVFHFSLPKERFKSWYKNLRRSILIGLLTGYIFAAFAYFVIPNTTDGLSPRVQLFDALVQTPIAVASIAVTFVLGVVAGDRMLESPHAMLIDTQTMDSTTG